MKLSIIILSFNTQDLTQQCLDSLMRIEDLQLNPDFEMIVVDNGSKDGSVEVVRREFTEVKLIEAGENLGFSKGNNLGVKNIHPDTKYVLFLNSDTVVPSGTISEMTRFMDENENIGVSTCKVELWSGGVDMDCHRGFPTPWVSLTRLLGLHKLFPMSGFFNGYYLGGKDLNLTHNIDACVGAFMLVRRSVGDMIGWWDEDFFLNGEDIDFCYRVKEFGHRIVYHPKVMITHYRGASKGTRKESKEVSKASLERKKMVTNVGIDAMGLFYDKHYRQKYPWIVSKMVDFGVFILRKKRIWEL